MVRIRRLSNLWLINCFVFIIPLSTLASSCGDLPKLDLQQCGHYDFIAYGRVDSELDCEDGSFHFTALRTYKGVSSEEFELFTSCKDQGLNLAKGEYWILFGKMNNSLEVQLNFCGHSRKQLPPGQKDYDTELRGASFQEELAFLNANFDLKKNAENELKARKYERINPVLVPVLLGIGLLFMVVGYFFIKRLK